MADSPVAKVCSQNAAFLPIFFCKQKDAINIAENLKKISKLAVDSSYFSDSPSSFSSPVFSTLVESGKRLVIFDNLFNNT